TRMMVITFLGDERYKKHDEHGHGGHDAHGGHGHGGGKPHESPIAMTFPLMVLAVLAVVGGYVGVPEVLAEKFLPYSMHEFTHSFYKFLAPVISEVPHVEGNLTGALEEDHGMEFMATVYSSLVGLIGIALGYFVFIGKPLLEMPGVLQAKYYV